MPFSEVFWTRRNQENIDCSRLGAKSPFNRCFDDMANISIGKERSFQWSAFWACYTKFVLMDVFHRRHTGGRKIILETRVAGEVGQQRDWCPF